MAYITLSLVTTLAVMKKRHLHPLEVLDVNEGELQGDKEEQHEVGVEDVERVVVVKVLEEGVGVDEVDTARMCMTSPHGAL